MAFSIKLASAAIAAGATLHIYTAFVQASGLNGFVLALLGLSLLPYIACAILVVIFRKYWPAAVAASLALAADLFTHYTVFVNPGSSTAAIGLLFMPILNLFFIVPVAAFVTGMLEKRKLRAGDS